MDNNPVYSPLEYVFETTMQREGKTLITYSNGIEFNAFFRIRNDNENQKDTITLYYGIAAPVQPGTLVKIRDEVYLALNKETVENDVYYKSAMIKCNGVYNSNDGRISNIPFYSDNMKSSLAVGNNVITTLNGNIEFLTEENEMSRQIRINDMFNEFSRTFKVTNLYSIDGILHAIAEVDADAQPEQVYSIQINNEIDSSLKPGSELQLEAIPHRNGSVTENATVEWTSSNILIATVDNTGKVTCLSEGTVKITARWIEKNLSKSVFITVENANIPPVQAYKYSISGNANLRCGYYRIYTICITDGEGNAVSGIDCQWNVVSGFEVNQMISGDKIKLSVEDENLIGSAFSLQVLVNGNVKAEMKVTVVE